MEFEDIHNLYEAYKKKYGRDTYKKISLMLKEAKILHHRDFLSLHPRGDQEHNAGGPPFASN